MATEWIQVGPRNWVMKSDEPTLVPEQTPDEYYESITRQDLIDEIQDCLGDIKHLFKVIKRKHCL